MVRTVLLERREQVAFTHGEQMAPQEVSNQVTDLRDHAPSLLPARQASTVRVPWFA